MPIWLKSNGNFKITLDFHTYYYQDLIDFSFLRGKPANKVRYRRTIVVSYGFPAFVSLCTLIAEYSAPRCATFRPRFGEEGCFFAGILFIENSNSITFRLFNFEPLNYDFSIKQCYFSEPTSKYIWFYLPMTILLLINAFVFCVLSRLLCKLDRDKRHLGISKQTERSDIVEKYE